MEQNKLNEVIIKEQDDYELEQEDEEEVITTRKLLWVVGSLVVITILGFLALKGFDYWDKSNHRRIVLQKIEQINSKLKSPEPINLSIMEGYRYELDEVIRDSDDNKPILKEITAINATMDNHPVYIIRGLNTISWATLQALNTEIDTVIAPFKDRGLYSIRTQYIPDNANDQKAYNIQKSHPNWSNEECLNIARHSIWVGMSKEQLILSRGKPLSIDKSFSASVAHEQWAYGKLGPFVYVENGIVISMQE